MIRDGSSLWVESFWLSAPRGQQPKTFNKNLWPDAAHHELLGKVALTFHLNGEEVHAGLQLAYIELLNRHFNLVDAAFHHQLAEAVVDEDVRLVTRKAFELDVDLILCRVGEQGDGCIGGNLRASLRAR